ncbi:hypothetical protein HOE04_01360 [archaeon]|jgi:hypothetical protein|nr:hypothetical protein [archaeon]
MSKGVYLTGVEISDGMFSGERIVKVRDYLGESCDGFFEDEMIVEGGLEVEVVGVESGLAFVKPSRGHEFMERRGVIVDERLLRYN